ncbi:hypothetical protein [Paracoccus actinidiae]|jgi:hypothetical protein|nr:hypothetical protein [Paracoccus sp. M09]
MAAQAERYGSDAVLFRAILNQTVRDGLAVRLYRPHDEVLRLAGQE